MNRSLSLLFALSLVFTGVSSASAQSDVRDLRPIIMLLVDTSGSMAYTDSSGSLPMCSGTDGERNRWAYVLEALTGEWRTSGDADTFACTRFDRGGASWCSGDPDCASPIPWFDHPGTTGQLTNGVLDGYSTRAKFGLMTFDPILSVTDGNDRDQGLLSEALWTSTLIASSEGARGGWSYGGPKQLTWPDCGDPRMIDLGAQNESSTQGALVSVGSDVFDDYTAVNDAIQSSLLAVRPYGGSPTAALLSDLEFYLNNHSDVAPIAIEGGAGDAYAGCRNRYGILITDGAPDGWLRNRLGCDTVDGCPYDTPTEIATRLCASSGGSCSGDLDGLYVVGLDVDPAEAPELHALAEAGGTCANEAEGCAYLIDSTTIDRSASATTPAALLSGLLADIIDQASPGTTTRGMPAITNANTLADFQGQSQINAGFRIPTTPGSATYTPWEGVLERRRFTCGGTDTGLTEQEIDANDRFHEILDRNESRRLLTALPDDPRNADAYIIGDGVADGLTSIAPSSGRVSTNRGNPSNGGGAYCDSTGGGPGGGGRGGGPGGGRGPSLDTETGVTIAAFDNSVDPAYLGVATAAERNDIVAWVEGSSREHKLGDIYNSSPVILEPPNADIPDESYNIFREQAIIADRPKILFVGSNDGVMHAFIAEDVTVGSEFGTYSGEYDAGDEIWGFVPPMILEKLDSARTSHQFLVDATPVVQEVFYSREAGAAPDGSIWHTVLIFGLRGGGNGYIALDVTNPFEPAFLWQVTSESMGLTYGQPRIGQVAVELGTGAGAIIQERAIAFLPGGAGQELVTTDCGGTPQVEADGHLSKPLGCPSRGIGRPPVTEGTLNARDHMRCWDETGRSITAVDPATGELVQLFGDDVFHSPMVGGISFFPGDVGNIATRAYMTDQDGVIWRFDISDTNVRNWEAIPLHDMFWNHDVGTAGQPAFFPPAVSTDADGNVVIVQGTGNTDNLELLVENRVVSLTERLTFDADGSIATDGVSAELNWEIILDEGEQVTGPIELFNGVAYFATFATASSPTDACAFGASRVWGVDYVEPDPSASNTSVSPQTPLPLAALPSEADPNTLARATDPRFNELIMGVQIAQRPSCSVIEEVSVNDPYIGPRRYQRATQTTPGGFELVATSSGGSADDGATITEVDVAVQQPPAFTRIRGWAGTIDD